MKTLAVLSALAAVAFSAPALPEAGHKTHQTESSHDVSLLATGKTASPQNFNNEALHEFGNVSPLQLDASHEPSARLHLGSKKPIIIKKKLGSSHLYRSSGEEQAQADPQETCMQEVKVKLCDALKTTTTEEAARSTVTEDADTRAMDSDVEHSIKMAKEAVENLQRDLFNIEHSPDAKMSQWKHSNSESDVEMHQEIEVARQALEHIQRNFGNLESMNLRAAKLKEREDLHDTTMKESESEEARLAQWKEAIDIIQRNVEIAKNKEDSFKSAVPEITSSDPKSLKKMDTLDNKSGLHETAMKSTENNPSLQHKHHDLNQHDADMRGSASSPAEVIINPELKVSPSEKKNTHETEELGKSSIAQEKAISDTNMAIEKSAEIPEKMKDTETALKLAEKSEKMIETKPVQSNKSSSKFEKDLEHMSTKKSAIEQEKSASAWKEPVENKLLAKAAEHDQSANLDTTKLMKPEDQVEKKHELNTTDETAIMQKVHQFSIGKSVEALKITEHPASIPTIKSADHVVEQNAQEKTITQFTEPTKESSVKHEAMTMKAAENAPVLLLEKSADSGSSVQPSALKQMKTSNLPITMGKSVHLDNSMAPSSDHHILHPTGKSINLDNDVASDTQTEMKTANLHIHPPMGKSVHMDSLQPQMEKKTVEGKSAMEHNKMMQWKQMHGARSAYGLGGYGGNAGGLGVGANGLSGHGAPSAGGIGGYGSGTSAANIGASAGGAGGASAGAVGAQAVFPNANVGGCAIPLLLSCSPSVVSGRLAKSHPSGYGVPAYRMGEDFKYHFKRDTKKTNEIPTNKVKRANPKREEKISLKKKL